MPYRHAHWYILALIPASMLAFAPYLLDLGEANSAIHWHSISATLWILLLAVQNVSIHNRKRGLHRGVGIASLILFPIYFTGFLLVFQSEAQRIVDGDPWATVFGPGIGTITLISALATAWMYYSGLRNRRRVHLHARWMIVTLFLFAESVGGRIINFLVPGLGVNALDDVRNIYSAFHLSQVLAIGLAVWLYRARPQDGFPYLFVIAALVLQSLALEIFDGFVPWRDCFVAMASWPVQWLLLPGLVFGMAVSMLGWRAGQQ